MGRTLAEKVWDEHVVRSATESPTSSTSTSTSSTRSPAAGLRRAAARRPPVRRPDLTLATEDHNVPTIDCDKPIADPVTAPRSRRCAATPRSSASACTRWATSSRASCTSSARSSG